MGSLPFIGGLCGDFSPHRTTMTQTKCCPIFAFWVVVVCLSNGSSRSHRALEGSSLPSCFFPFVFLLRHSTLALRLGVSGCGRVRSPMFFFVVTEAGPASHRVRLWQGGPASTVCGVFAAVLLCDDHWYSCFLKFGYWLSLKFARPPGPFGGRGEMAMAVASSARLAFFRGAVCASTPCTRCGPFVPCTATVH